MLLEIDKRRNEKEILLVCILQYEAVLTNNRKDNKITKIELKQIKIIFINSNFKKTYIGLKRAKQLTQKWALRRENKNSTFNKGTFGIVVFQNHIFFQAFHCIKLIFILQLNKHYLNLNTVPTLLNIKY